MSLTLGSGMMATMPLSAPPFDPTTLVLSGYWRGPYSAMPWVRVASAGLSGNTNRDIVGNGSTDPSPGTPLNGIAPIGYRTAQDNEADVGPSAGNANIFLSASAYTVTMLISPIGTQPAISSPEWTGAFILFINSVDWYIALSSSGFSLLHSTTGFDDPPTITIAAATNTYHAVDIVFGGGNVKMRVDGGSYTTVSVPNLNSGSLSGNVLRLSRFIAHPNYDLIELMTSTIAQTDADLDKIRLHYFNPTYGLSFT